MFDTHFVIWFDQSDTRRLPISWNLYNVLSIASKNQQFGTQANLSCLMLNFILNLDSCSGFIRTVITLTIIVDDKHMSTHSLFYDFIFFIFFMNLPCADFL